MGLVRKSPKNGGRQMAISRGVTKIPSCLRRGEKRERRREEIEEEERIKGEEKERERRRGERG